MTPSPLMLLVAVASGSPFDSAWHLFRQGGFFMIAILACSLVGFAVIVLKALVLSRRRVVPFALARQLEFLPDPPTEDALELVRNECNEGGSSLARLCTVALSSRSAQSAEVKEAVQSSAHEEIVRMSMGLAVLDVVITIAPLLGLLGTASGLVVVFKDVGAEGNYIEMSKGIARALSTTIAGVAVAVPSVIAHSYFSRKIETMAARLEVLLGRLVALAHRHQSA